LKLCKEAQNIYQRKFPKQSEQHLSHSDPEDRLAICQLSSRFRPIFGNILLKKDLRVLSELPEIRKSLFQCLRSPHGGPSKTRSGGFHQYSVRILEATENKIKQIEIISILFFY